jgi:hypothetical protein
MTPSIAGFVALDNLRHDGISYEPGDELDAEDFTEQQLEQLLADGVIVAGMVGVKETDIGNEPDAGDKTDIGNEPDARDETGTGDEPDAGDKTDIGNEPDARDETGTGDEPGADDKTDIGNENQTGAETKSEASEPTAKPKKK